MSNENVLVKFINWYCILAGLYQLRQDKEGFFNIFEFKRMRNELDSSVIERISNMTENDISTYADAMANSFVNKRGAYESILYVIGTLLSIYEE